MDDKSFENCQSLRCLSCQKSGFSINQRVLLDVNGQKPGF